MFAESLRFNPPLLIVAFAAALLTACTEQSPNHLVQSAHGYLAQGNHDAAMIQLRNALQQRPEDGALRLLLGRTLLDNGDPAAATRELRKALQYGQPQDAVLPLLARAMLEQGEAKQLLSEFGSQSGVPALSTAESEAAFKSALGQAQLQSGQTSEAAASFRAAVAAAPAHLSAQIGLVRVLAIEGEADEAAKIAGSLVAAHPMSAEAHMLVSDLQSMRGDQAASIAALEQAVRANGRYVPARYALIATLIGEQQFDAAAVQLEEARKLARTDLRIHYFDAVIALGQDDLVKARESSQRILKHSPDHVPSLVLAAAVELQATQPSAAEIHLRNAIALAPQHAGARRMLVRAHLLADQPAKALDALQPLLAAGVADPLLAMLAGETYLANGDMREASAYFMAASESPSTRPAAQTRLGQISLVAGDVEAGIRQLEAVTAAADAPIQADLALTAAYMRSRDFDKALQIAQRLARKQPERPLAYQLIGSVYSSKKDSARAREYFLKALDLAPGYLPAVAGLSRLDLEANKPGDARKRFSAIVAKEPNNDQALLGLADVMARTGGSASDIADTLQRATRADPQSGSARLALIAHHLRIDQTSLALSAAQEAAAALPNDVRVLYALGQAQEAAGQTNQAIETFNRLAVLEPRSKLLLAQLAERALRAGNLQSAVVLYQAVVEQEPENFVALNNLAWAAGQIGDPKAIEYAHGAVQIAPENAAALDTLGSLLVAKGDTDKGVEYLRKAKALAPKRSDIRLNYAKALIKAGKKDVARSELEALQATAVDTAGRAEIDAVLKGL